MLNLFLNIYLNPPPPPKKKKKTPKTPHKQNPPRNIWPSFLSNNK